mgnify:CR=1 FL=1
MSGGDLATYMQRMQGTATPSAPAPTPMPYQGQTYTPQAQTGSRPSGADRQFYQPIYQPSYAGFQQSYNPMAVSNYNPYAQSSFYQPYGVQSAPMGGGKGGAMQPQSMYQPMQQSAPMGGGKGGAMQSQPQSMYQPMQPLPFGFAQGGLTSLR